MTDKISVQTTGAFMLVDPISGDVVSAEGYSPVSPTSFIDDRIASKQLELEPAPEKPAKAAK